MDSIELFWEEKESTWQRQHDQLGTSEQRVKSQKLRKEVKNKERNQAW